MKTVFLVLFQSILFVSCATQAVSPPTKIMPVVMVINLLGGGGTGFFVEHKKHGLLLITNNHVCEENRFMIIKGSNNQLKAGAVIGRSRNLDLCAIKVAVDTVPFERSLIKPPLKQPVHTEGFPGLMTLTKSYGVFEGYASERNFSFLSPGQPCEFPMHFAMVKGKRACYLEQVNGLTTTKGSPGSSGSPVLTNDDRLLGVVVSVDDFGNQAFIPGEFLDLFLGDL